MRGGSVEHAAEDARLLVAWTSPAVMEKGEENGERWERGL